MKEAIWETIKEGFRIALFAGLAALVAWGTQELSSLNPDSTFVIVGTIVLRLADKYLHKNENIGLKGISPV